MSKSIDGLLCNKNLAAFGAVTSLCQTGFGTGGRHRRKLYRIVYARLLQGETGCTGAVGIDDLQGMFTKGQGFQVGILQNNGRAPAHGQILITTQLLTIHTDSGQFVPICHHQENSTDIAANGIGRIVTLCHAVAIQRYPCQFAAELFILKLLLGVICLTLQIIHIGSHIFEGIRIIVHAHRVINIFQSGAILKGIASIYPVDIVNDDRIQRTAITECRLQNLRLPR